MERGVARRWPETCGFGAHPSGAEMKAWVFSRCGGPAQVPRIEQCIRRKAERQPLCSGSGRWPDGSVVLREAVQHLRES